MENSENSWSTKTPPPVKASNHLPVAALRQLRELFAAQRADCERELASLRLARVTAMQSEERGGG